MNKRKIKVKTIRLRESNITLVIIYARIDDCNSLLNGLPDYCLNRLQKNN